MSFIWDAARGASVGVNIYVRKISEVVAPRNRGLDGPLHFGPSVDHLVVAEAKDNEVEGTQFCVTGSIKLKAVRVDVVGGTIDLKYEPPAD